MGSFLEKVYYLKISNSDLEDELTMGRELPRGAESRERRADPKWKRVFCITCEGASARASDRKSDFAAHFRFLCTWLFHSWVCLDSRALRAAVWPEGPLME